MGVVSFAIAEAAEEAGAMLACGVPVAEILPGEGVRFEGGEVIRASTIICNADPKRALAMMAADAAMPASYRRQLEDWKVRSPVMKFNAALSRLPTFTAAAGEEWPYHSMVSVTAGLDAAQRAFLDCVDGRVNVGYGEIYFQTGYDPTPAPPGRHLMSVFGQYGPYELQGSTWDEQRSSVERQFIDLIATVAPTSRDASSTARCWVLPTSRSGWASPAGTSSRARRCPTRCGTGGSRHGPPCPASTSAAPRPIRRDR